MGKAPPPALGLCPEVVGVAAAPAVDERGALLGAIQYRSRVSVAAGNRRRPAAISASNRNPRSV